MASRIRRSAGTAAANSTADCRAALRAIARGGDVTHRVFFADEAAALAAGYRPCAVCMPPQYAAWKDAQSGPSRGGARKTARA